MNEKTIKEIAEILSMIDDEKHPFIEDCKNDKRKGVQQLLTRWKTNQVNLRKNVQQFYEMSKYEKELYTDNIQYIAGVDEVGRGPLAGPVVAAAVILPKEFILPGLNDSKKLSEQKREELFTIISKEAISIGIGIVSAKEIDEINIYQASKLAMKKAVLQLNPAPSHLLIDAMQISIDIPQTPIIKGDSKSYSIAASSVIAKVTRDRLMKRIAEMYPQYGFDKHMGYGTPSHLEALKLHGRIEEHRLSFSPVQQVCSGVKS